MNVDHQEVPPDSRRIRPQNYQPSPEQHFGTRLCLGDKVSVYYDCLKPVLFPEHSHKHAELLLTFDSAQAEITWQGKGGRANARTVAAHQFCLIPPNTPHSCDWRNKADVVVVYFEDRLLKEHVTVPLDTVIVADFQPLARRDACLWSLEAIFRHLCHRPAASPPSFIEGIGTALASRILEQHFQPGRATATRPGLSARAMRETLEYIDANMREPITVPDLARNAALGVDQFAKLLKGSTGTSPLQFLLKHRVEKALELLRTREFRVAEAAYEVGFYDQSHLNRHCQKFFGFTPRSVIKAARISGSSSKNPETSKIFAAALG
ncbi:MAG TPA: AraC family transcriptional regulator [Opitutaceae bacterium]|jgi:AraC family transcriptional regulator|nr:AraC family transcriptional regulator [Opitutaceae bacterium]